MSIGTSRHPPVGTFRPHGPVDVAVVLVSHNSADDLPAILGSLRREARDIAMRVVVADNSSTDASFSVAAAQADVVALGTGGNLGYAGGINVAMGRVGAAEAVLVLNPDVRIGPGAISALLKRLRSDPRIGVVVPRILDHAGRTSFSLRREPTLMRALGDALIGRHWPGRPAILSEQVSDPAVYEASATTDWATGAVLLVAAEVATHVGPWDERFFLYSEETDFLHRVRQAGWMVFYEPAAAVTHRGGGSGVSDELVALTLVNKVRYMDKHRPRSSGVYRSILLTGEHLRLGDATHRHARWALRHRDRWEALPGPVRDAQADAPDASVVIPAHNEEAVISAALAPLAGPARSGALEVVVVCNGCTDRTADLARSLPGVRVLEIPTASKTAALVTGDAATTRWPRFYLDADIVVSSQALVDVARRLDAGDVLAARPAARIDTSGCDRMVRAYFRARKRMPSHSAALWGAGVYALSEEGHRRLGRFPEVTGDDLHVDRLFNPAEKAIVDTVPVLVRAPRDTRALVAVLTRARRGAAEQEVDTARSSLRELLATVRGPVSAVDAVVYAGLALVARRRGNATTHTAFAWERDETTRAPRPAPLSRSIDHVICTRFNLPTAGPESLLRAQDDWLVNRMALFERYTVPSVRGQSVRDFHWLVYLDPASPAWLRQRLQPLVDEGLVTPRYRESVTWQDVAADARDITGARRDVLLTTNLDNDDALACDFVARLQRLAVAHPGSALFLRSGLVLHGDALFLRHDANNAFCSVSEPWQRPVTAWRDWHTLLGEHLPVVSVDGDPGWLQVVHGQNVSNRVRGVRVCPTTYRSHFPGLLDEVPVVDLATLTVDRTLRAPARGASELVRGVGKRVVLSTLGKDGLDRVKQRVKGAPPMSGRLRVLLVTHDASRTGAPRVALLVARALVDRGHRVSIVSLGGGPLLADFAALAPTCTAPLIRVRGRVRRTGRVRTLTWLLDTLAALVLLARNPSDVVYVNSTAAASFIRPAQWLRRRVVLHVHESLQVADGLLAQARVKDLAGIELVACSPSTHDDLCHLSGRAPEEVHLIPSVPDEEHVLATARPIGTGHNGAQVVGACGSVNHRKGTDLWLEAATRVIPARRRQTRFVWVGDLSGRPEPEHPHGVGFTGALQDPYAQMAGFDVATLPSRDDPFPLVVLEAMLLGVPVVAFDVGGVRAQVGDTGVVVPAGDVRAFAAAVIDLLDDDDLRARLGTAARERVKDLYSSEAFRARITALVDGMFRGGR